MYHIINLKTIFNDLVTSPKAVLHLIIIVKYDIKLNVMLMHDILLYHLYFFFLLYITPQVMHYFCLFMDKMVRCLRAPKESP